MQISLLTRTALAVMIVALGLGGLTHNYSFAYHIEVFTTAILSGLAWVASAVLAMDQPRSWHLPGVLPEDEYKIWNYVAAVLTAALAALGYFSSC